MQIQARMDSFNYSNKLTTRIETIIQDKPNMGRWMGFTYQLGNQNKLHIITAYIVNEQKVTSINSMSTNAQQFYMLQARGISTVTPRQQFITDFVDQFHDQCQNSDEMTILMIDANTSMNSGKKMVLVN
jgi:isocitrate lyase